MNITWQLIEVLERSERIWAEQHVAEPINCCYILEWSTKWTRDKERSDEELPIPTPYRNIFIYPISNKYHKMGKQICPKCGSKNIRLAETISKLGDPMMTQGMIGWECLDCGYIGKDFFIKPKKK